MVKPYYLIYSDVLEPERSRVIRWFKRRGVRVHVEPWARAPALWFWLCP